MYIINFKGNIVADAVVCLREEISAILLLLPMMKFWSDWKAPRNGSRLWPGFSQLLRLKNAQIPLTICVDKVAASGGYMMALADKLVAAPFAIIGSIGVLFSCRIFIVC